MTVAVFLLLALVLSARGEPARAPGHPAARGPRVDSLYRDTLAWVGSRSITAADLVQRIEWMPWPEKQGSAGMDSAKVRALQSLVGESLLTQEAESRALGDSGEVARMRMSLRKALARDALYHQVAGAAPAIPTAEVDRIVRRQRAPASPAARRALRRAVTDSLLALGERQRAEEFMGRLLSTQRVVVDAETFMLFADSLRSLTAASLRASPGGHALVSEYVDVLISRLRPALDRPLAQLPDGPLRLGDALEEFRFYPASVRSLERRQFAAELSAQLKSVVEGELLAREALRRRLDQRPEVEHDLEMWSSAWRSQLLLEQTAAGVGASEDDAFRRLALLQPERARRLCQVDVAEILCDTEGRAARIRTLLDAGADFDSLARLYGKRSEWAARGGRSGFFPAAQRPRLGDEALLAPLDSLRGPVMLPEGFSVFRVRGKRLDPDSTTARALLDSLREQASVERRADRVARYVASLAERSRVVIRYAALSRIDVFSANMVTKRTLGFGGGMLAAPSLTPMWDWVQVWRAAHVALP